MLLASVGLSTARLVGFAAIFPAFTIVQMPNSLRFGVTFALAAPLMPGSFFWISEATPNIFQLAGIGMREALIGAGLGLLCGVPIWAASAAGDVVDLYRGADSQGLFNPALEEEGSPTGALLSIIVLLVFVSVGGLTIVTNIVYASYEFWPLSSTGPMVSAEGVKAVLRSFDWFARLMLAIAAPFLIAMFAAEIGVGIIGRAARRYSSLDLALVLKTLIYVVLLPGYLFFFADAIMGPFSRVRHLADNLGAFIQ